MTTPEARDPVLHSERLVLRVPVEDDADALCAYYVRNDARFRPWREHRSHDVEDYRAWIRARENASPNHELTFVARNIRADGIVALVTLSGFRRDTSPQGMLSYSVDAAFEGRGFASEAVARVVRHAREELGFHAITADYDIGNERSARLLARLGFIEVGRTSVIPGFERFMRAAVSTRLSW